MKLIDVYPEKHSDEAMRGFQLMIAGDVIRGRYHKSIEKPAALTPNVPVQYVIPVVVSGQIAAHLFAATSGTDSDGFRIEF